MPPCCAIVDVRDGDARDEPSAADGDDDRFEVRVLLEELEADRPLPGHHEIVVERVHEDALLGALDPRGLFERFVVARAKEDDAPGRLGGRGARGAGALREKAARALDLVERRALGHHDRRVDPEARRVVRDPLRVIARARADDAARALRRRATSAWCRRRAL